MPNLSTRIEGGFDTGSLYATGPIAAFTRVSLNSSGLLQPASATEVGDGVLDHDAVASQTDCRFHCTNAPGTKFGLASGVIASAGLTLYAAASGQVSTTQATNAPVVGKSCYATADQGVVTYHSRTVI